MPRIPTTLLTLLLSICVALGCAPRLWAQGAAAAAPTAVAPPASASAASAAAASAAGSGAGKTAAMHAGEPGGVVTGGEATNADAGAGEADEKPSNAFEAEHGSWFNSIGQAIFAGGAPPRR